MCHMRVRASGRNQGVQRGVADACALGGAKGACRGVVLCMLVVARANALRSARQMQTLQTTFICLSLSTEGASYMVGCGLMSSIQPCMRGTPRTDDATAKWFATRVWLGTSEKNRFWPLRSGPGRPHRNDLGINEHNVALFGVSVHVTDCITLSCSKAISVEFCALHKAVASTAQ